MTMEKKVEKILYWYPDTRNSDALLTKLIWEKYYRCTYPLSEERFLELMRIASQETIKRFRAYIQNTKKKYPPTIWKVARWRGWKEKEWKIVLGYSVMTPGDHIEELQQKQHIKTITQTKLI